MEPMREGTMLDVPERMRAAYITELGPADGIRGRIDAYRHTT